MQNLSMHSQGNSLIDWLLVDWLFGCLVVWLFGCLVVWLFGCLVVWLFGCLVVWLFGCLVVGCWLLVVGCWIFRSASLLGLWWDFWLRFRFPTSFSPPY